MSDGQPSAPLTFDWPKREPGSWALAGLIVASLVISFGQTLRECENELRSTLEDWLLVGLRLGHKLPVLSGIYLNN